MSKNTKIEWCDHTFNPVLGCTRVSPGCVNCYAEAFAKRFAKRFWGEGQPTWGPGARRVRTSKASWDQVRRWNNLAGKNHFEAKVIRCNGVNSSTARLAELEHRPRVFAPSMSDWLDPSWDLRDLADFLALIHECPNLDFLLLTKRPELWRERVISAGSHLVGLGALESWIVLWLNGIPPANVWIGTTVEDQRRADERIPELLKIPARVRFLSCEPLLGPVDFRLVPGFNKAGSAGVEILRNFWVIAGGESGPGARPMHPDWSRSLRDQCQAAGVPFFFKQWGEWGVCDARSKNQSRLISMFPDGKTMKMPEWYEHCRKNGPQGGMSAAWGAVCLDKHGKRNTGRLLDGREWSEFPADAAGVKGGAR